MFSYIFLLVSQAQRFLQFLLHQFHSVSYPYHHHFTAPGVLFCSHPWHCSIFGLQPRHHDNGLGFASTFLEGCSGRNLEGNGGGVHWVESTILHIKERKVTSVNLCQLEVYLQKLGDPVRKKKRTCEYK